MVLLLEILMTNETVPNPEAPGQAAESAPASPIIGRFIEQARGLYRLTIHGPVIRPVSLPNLQEVRAFEGGPTGSHFVAFNLGLPPDPVLGMGYILMRPSDRNDANDEKDPSRMAKFDVASTQFELGARVAKGVMSVRAALRKQVQPQQLSDDEALHLLGRLSDWLQPVIEHLERDQQPSSPSILSSAP